MTDAIVAATPPAAPAAPTPPASPSAPAAPSAPLSAAEAASKLATLRTDNAWGDRVLRGEPGALAELRTLSQIISSTGSDLDAFILAAHDQPDINIDGQLSPKKVAGEIPALRESGLSDDVITELLAGRTSTRQELDAVKRLQTMRHSSKEWVDKYLAGDHEARRESRLMSIVLMQAPA
jgi:hypothetical protein